LDLQTPDRLALPRHSRPRAPACLHLTSIGTLRLRTTHRHNGLLYLLRPVLHKGRTSRTTHPDSHKCQAFQMLHMSHVIRQKGSPSKTLHSPRSGRQPTRDPRGKWDDSQVSRSDPHRLQQLCQNQDQVRQEVPLFEMCRKEPQVYPSTNKTFIEERNPHGIGSSP
jgi:hypothetical protein